MTIGAFPHSAALNISGLVIALTVALLTRAVRLHDLISDVLGIRKDLTRGTSFSRWQRSLGSLLQLFKERPSLPNNAT
jgi:hypothetical protein